MERTNEEMFRKMLFDLALQLGRWANESEEGGWSTHQVEPMRAKREAIMRFLKETAWRP